jgi:hypothetical protein
MERRLAVCMLIDSRYSHTISQLHNSTLTLIKFNCNVILSSLLQYLLAKAYKDEEMTTAYRTLFSCK